jgi:hypothetical protein
MRASSERLARLAVSLVALLGVLQVVAHFSGSSAPEEVASLNLTCSPASPGLRCRLLALFRDVSRPPRDVTSEASWRLSGVAGARISRGGAIDALEDGDVDIEALYGSRRVEARGRLRHDSPGQMLAALRGRVYLEINGRLQPAAQAYVEVVGGTNAGLSTTTRADGSYELVGLVAGDAVDLVDVFLRATKAGCSPAEGSTQIHSGDNRLSLVLFPNVTAGVTKLSRNVFTG